MRDGLGMGHSDKIERANPSWKRHSRCCSFILAVFYLCNNLVVGSTTNTGFCLCFVDHHGELFGETKERNQMIVYFDIDGVCANFVQGIKDNTGLQFDTIRNYDFSEFHEENRAKILAGFQDVATLKPYEGMAELTQRLSKQGHTVRYITARPTTSEFATIGWLVFHGFAEASEVVFAKDKGFYLSFIKSDTESIVLIEDCPANIFDVRQKAPHVCCYALLRDEQAYTDVYYPLEVTVVDFETLEAHLRYIHECTRDLFSGMKAAPQKVECKQSNPKDMLGCKKPPISTIPAGVLQHVGVALLEGQTKYGAYNFRAVGSRASIYYDATIRHLMSWWEGEDTDPDSGLSHVIKAIASLVVIADGILQDNLNDDRPPKGNLHKEELAKIINSIHEKYGHMTPIHYTEKGQNNGKM
jgi:hypothetical protein